MTALAAVTAMRVPRSSRIEQARLTMSVVGGLICLMTVFQAIDSGVRPAITAVSVAANLAVAAVVAFTVVHDRHYPVGFVPLTALLAVVTGSGLNDPVGVTLVCIGLVIAQSMYGSWRSLVLRVICLEPVIPLSVHFSASPLSDDHDLTLRTLLPSLPVLPVFALLMYLLRVSLESQAATIARETFLAQLSSELLAATTMPAISRAMVGANHRLTDLSPGMITLELSRIGPVGGARLLNAHGADGLALPEVIPAEALGELPPIGVELVLPLRAGAAALTRAGLPARRWHAIALQREPDAPTDLVLHGVRAGLGNKLFGTLSPEEVEFLGVLGTMREHWRAAMDRITLRGTLIEAAGLDDVTGLPDRSAMMRRTVECVHAGRGQVGLVLLQLDGIAQVEAERGIVAADQAMYQLARRVTGVVGDRGHVGRGGDESFAVVIPGADAYDEIEALVTELERALREPILLPGGPPALGLHVGVARSTRDSTAADLLERAVTAMTLNRSELREPNPSGVTRT